MLKERTRLNTRMGSKVHNIFKKKITQSVLLNPDEIPAPAQLIGNCLHIRCVYLNNQTADVDSFLAQFIQQFTNYRPFVMHTLIFVLTLTTGHIICCWYVQASSNIPTTEE